MDETLRAVSIDRRPSIELRKYFAGVGFESLCEAGLHLVETGVTFQEELDLVAMKVG